MNEMEVSVSSVLPFGRRRLPLIRVNRRFLLCCALCATVLSLFLIENPATERIQTLTSPPASRPMARADFPRAVRLESPPLQIQPIVLPTTPFVDTFTWRLAGQDYMTRRRGRWERFETEFGITEPEHSPVLRSMQSAKYSLDRLVFAAKVRAGPW